MPSVGNGVQEIRIHRDHEWRVIYLAKLQKPSMCYTPSRKKHARPPKQPSMLRVAGSSCY